MDRHLAMARNLLGGIALAALALSGAPSRAADGDHDGRWRLEYSCGQNTANGAAPYRARVELSVEGGAVAARTSSRNTRLNRDDTEQWSGRFTGAALAIKVAGSASDGAAWDSEWTGAASSPTEGSVTGGVFAPVRGARTQVRACEGRMTLVAPAPASLAAAAAREADAARQREADAAAARQREAEQAAARQREAEEAASRQRQAEEEAARQREAAAARQREEAEAAARQQRAAAATPAPSPAPASAAPASAASTPAAPASAAPASAAPAPASAAPPREQQAAAQPPLASDPGFRRSEIRWFRDRLVAANADHRQLDLLLYFKAAGAGAVQRNMAGAYQLAGDGPVCVDAREILKGDARIELSRLEPGPKVARGAIGLAELRQLDRNTAQAAGMRMPGWGPPIVVGRVVPGSAAERAGFKDGDIVLSVDGKQTHPSTFLGIFAESLPGRVLQFEVWRAYAPGDPAAPQPAAAPAPRRGAGNASETTQVAGRAIRLEARLGERMVDMPDAPTHLTALDLYRALRLSPPRLHAAEPAGGGDLAAADKALHQDLANDIAAAASAALRMALGAGAEAMLTETDSCGAAGGSVPRAAQLVPRFRAEGPGIDLRDWTLVATLPPAGLREARSQRVRAVELARAAREEFVRTMAASPPSGEGAIYGVLWVGRRSSSAAPCVVEAEGEDAPRHGIQVEHVLRSESFRAEWPGTPRQPRRFDGVEALFQSIKGRQHGCEVVPGNGRMLASLQAALARDGIGTQFLPVRVGEAELAELHAGALGFRALGNRSAAYAWLFAQEIGGLRPRHVEALFALGVDTPDAVGEAVVRHEDEHRLGPIPEDADALVAFLNEEREARQRGTTIRRLRAEREAAALRAATEAEAARRGHEKRRAAEFPFVAEFTCSIGQSRTSLQACLHAGGVGTEIELRNGGEHRVFKIHDVAEMGEWDGGALRVDLRRNFSIKAQNADETLVLGLVVRDRASGSVRYQRQAGRFGVLQVSN
ncbi:MAG: PDZ domain-containing protein [Alphaproteobacteria bacterium]